MRSVHLFFLLGVATGCTRAPAPCVRVADCETGACINGTCLQPMPLVPDQGERNDGMIELDGGPLDRGVDRDRGLDPMDLDPLPDAQPGCEGLSLTVTLPDDLGPLRRDEPVQLTVDANFEAQLSYESTAGGAFVENPTGARWIARDEVRWPWRTAPITLTVHGDFEDCRVTRRVQVTLLGDLLISDVSTGQIQAVGSNGTVFGQWRLVDGTGINTMTPTPDGGLIVAIRGPSTAGRNEDPEMVRLNANGEEIRRFATTDLNGEKLFNRPVTHVYVVGDEVVAVNGHDDAVHWFDLDGAYLRSFSTDGVWVEALSPWGDDKLVYALNAENRVRLVGGEMPDEVGGVPRAVYGLYPLVDGSVAVVQNRSEDAVHRLETDGRLVEAPSPPVNYSIGQLVAFDEGYIALSTRGSWLIELDADLTPLAGDDFKFASFGGGNPRAVVWLHDR
jgi:hypothetical protein